MLAESMVQILLTVQPGTRLHEVETYLGVKARLYEKGQKPNTDFPLEVLAHESVAEFDSYQLPEFGGVLDFWVVVDKDNRVVTLHVKSYPIDWHPLHARPMH